MHPDALDAELSREPFIPLRIHLADGSSFEVPNPGLTYILGLQLYSHRPIRPNSHRAIDQMVVSLRQITRVETIGTANHTNGHSQA